jgi:hypothetical protein
MHSLQNMASVFKTARVSAAYIRVGDVGPTLSDALAHSLDAPFGIVQTYVEEPGEEQSFKRCSDRRVCPSSCEGCCCGVSGFNSPRNCIRFQQITSTLEFDLPDQTALAGTVRPGKNRRDGHASGCRAFEFPDYAVIGFARSAGDKAHLEFAAIRLLHDIQIPLPIPIENRNAGLERFQTGASTGRNNRSRKLLRKETAVLHD